MMVRLGGVFIRRRLVRGAMHAVAVPEPSCPGCLGDGRCWVCLGTGRLRSAAEPDVGCHVCGGSGSCARCPVVVDVGAVERAARTTPAAATTPALG